MTIYSYIPDTNSFLFRISSSSDQLFESSSFSYNELSDNYFINYDYGNIVDSIDESEDYGSISDTATIFETYGYTTEKNTTAFGIVGNIESSTEYSITRVSEIQGTTFLFNGRSDVYINSSYIGYGLISTSGTIISEKNTESYVGTGRVFGFGSKAERVVASYNNSSVLAFNSIDYGFISSAEDESDNYGSIIDIANLPSERDDYGDILRVTALLPFGLTSFSSAVIEKNTESYVGSGTLFNFGDAKVFVLPIHYGRGTIKIRGAYSDLKNTESYVGTGSLFGFGSKAESATTAYNESSTVDYEGLDYGFIGSSENTIDDYGSITDIANLPSERDDYGLVTGRGLRPFGLTSFSSAVIEKNTESYVGSGTLFNFGTGKIFVLPIHYGKGVLKIRGAYSDLKNTESYVGTGSLFGFGSKAERVVASYNESSVVDYEGLDYGFISSSEDTIDDYGSILDDPNLPSERDDYGLVTGRGLRPFGLTSFSSAVIEKNTESYVGSGSLFNFGDAKVFVLPIHYGRGVLKIRGAYSDLKNTESYVGTGSLFGFSSTTEAFGPKPPVSGLFRISGSAIEKNTEDYVGTGSLFTFISSIESTKPAFVGSGTLKITGAYTNLKNTESYVGTGSLFGFGSKAESTTASYNESSVVDYEGLDYGFISSSEDTIDDYGSILDDPNLPSERDDYGLVTGRGLRPFGLTSFSSAVIEKNTESYVGSGSLFNFGSKTESNTYSSISIGLFKFSGSAIQKNTEVYVGSGSIFSIVSKEERTAFAYNESSVVDYEGLDYGFISSSEDTIDDYGSILDDPNLPSERDDYGLVTGRGLRPFGKLRFTGAYTNLKNTESYVGTGSLFGFSSTTEAFGPKPPVSGLFRISGSAAESITPTTEIGSGSLFAFGGSSTILQKANIGTGLFRFSGNLVERNTESYVGTGSLFGFSSTTEAFGPKPPVSGLFRISGSAAESITPTTEIGSGTVSVFQQTAILDAEDKIRLVSAFERKAITEIGEPRAIKLSGKVGLYFQFRETGAGNLSIKGKATIRLKPIHIGSGFIFTRGAAAESTTPATEIGSGSIFTFVSKTETTGINPPESIQLFKFNGTSVERNSEAYVGIGIERINVETLVLIRPRYPGSGRITIDSQPIQNRSYSHVTTGTLFGFGSASEYISNAYEEKIYAIKIRGSSENRHTENYVGRGSIFTFISSSESLGANPPENTAIFKIGGSGIDRTTPTVVGSGSVNISKGSGRPDRNNKTFIVSSDESRTTNNVAKPEQLNISGFATVSRPSVYKGKGSLFGFGSKAETATFSPDNTRELFKISGTASEKNTESYTGSGSVFSFVSTSNSSTNSIKAVTNLFRLNGSATESFSEGLYIGSGSITTDLQSTSKVTFTPKSTTILFNFVGGAIEKNTEAYTGSGTILSFASTTKSVFYNYTVTQRAFRIFGNTFEAFGKSNYNGYSTIEFNGSSTDLKVNYKPPRKTRIYII